MRFQFRLSHLFWITLICFLLVAWGSEYRKRVELENALTPEKHDLTLTVPTVGPPPASIFVAPNQLIRPYGPSEPIVVGGDPYSNRFTNPAPPGQLGPFYAANPNDPLIGAFRPTPPATPYSDGIVNPLEAFSDDDTSTLLRQENPVLSTQPTDSEPK